MTLSLLGAIFALVGVPFVWLARRTFARDEAIRAWPTVPGRIESSHVASSTGRYRDKNGAAYEQTMHQPVVRYSYSVGVLKLEGKSVARSIDGMNMSLEPAQRIVETYPAGKDVTVLYDPSDPTKAHLEVRRSIGAVILLLFGALWLGIGALLVALSFL